MHDPACGFKFELIKTDCVCAGDNIVWCERTTARSRRIEANAPYLGGVEGGLGKRSIFSTRRLWRLPQLPQIPREVIN